MINIATQFKRFSESVSLSTYKDKTFLRYTLPFVIYMLGK
jgi:hypothetical protein